MGQTLPHPALTIFLAAATALIVLLALNVLGLLPAMRASGATPTSATCEAHAAACATAASWRCDDDLMVATCQPR